MSGELSESGQRLTDRLFGRVSSRSLIGPGSRFYERFGFADPLAPAEDGSGRGGFVFLSGASYYAERDAWLQDYEELYARLGFFYSNRRAMARMARSGPAVRSRLVELALGDVSEPVLLGRHDLESPIEDETPADERPVRRVSSRRQPKRRFSMAPTLKDLLAELGPGVSNSILRELELAVASSPEELPQEVVTQTVKRSLRKMSPPAARALRHSLARRTEQRRDRDVTQLVVASERPAEQAGPRRGLRRVLRQNIAGQRLAVRASVPAAVTGADAPWIPAAPIAAAPMAPLADDYVTPWTPSRREVGASHRMVSDTALVAPTPSVAPVLLAPVTGTASDDATYAPATARRRSPRGASPRSVPSRSWDGVRRVAARLDRAQQLVVPEANTLDVAAGGRVPLQTVRVPSGELVTLDMGTGGVEQQGTATRAPARRRQPAVATAAPAARTVHRTSNAQPTSLPGLRSMGRAIRPRHFGRGRTLQKAVDRMSLASAPPAVASAGGAVPTRRGPTTSRSPIHRASAPSALQRLLVPAPVAASLPEAVSSPFAVAVPMVVPMALAGDLVAGGDDVAETRVVRVKRSEVSDASPVSPSTLGGDDERAASRSTAASVAASHRGDRRTRVDRHGRELLTAAPVLSAVDRPVRSTGVARLMMAPEGVVEWVDDAPSTIEQRSAASERVVDRLAVPSTPGATRPTLPTSSPWTLLRAMASDGDMSDDVQATRTPSVGRSLRAGDTVPVDAAASRFERGPTDQQPPTSADLATPELASFDTPATRIARRLQRAGDTLPARSLLGERGIAPSTSLAAEPFMSIVVSDPDVVEGDMGQAVAHTPAVSRRRTVLRQDGVEVVESTSTVAPARRRSPARQPMTESALEDGATGLSGALRGVAPIVRAASRRMTSGVNRQSLVSSPVAYLQPEGPADTSSATVPMQERVRSRASGAARSAQETSSGRPTPVQTDARAVASRDTLASTVARRAAPSASVQASERAQRVVQESKSGVAPMVLADRNTPTTDTPLEHPHAAPDAASVANEPPLRRAVRRLDAGQVGRDSAVAPQPLAHLEANSTPSVLPESDRVVIDQRSPQVSGDSAVSDAPGLAPMGGLPRTSARMPHVAAERTLRPTLRTAARVAAAEQQGSVGPIAALPTLHLELALSDLFDTTDADAPGPSRVVRRMVARSESMDVAATQLSGAFLVTEESPLVGGQTVPELVPVFVAAESTAPDASATETAEARSATQRRPASRRALRRLRRGQAEPADRSLVRRPLPDVAADVRGRGSAASRPVQPRVLTRSPEGPTQDRRLVHVHYMVADEQAGRLDVAANSDVLSGTDGLDSGLSGSPVRYAASRLDRKDESWGWPEMEMLSSEDTPTGERSASTPSAPSQRVRPQDAQPAMRQLQAALEVGTPQAGVREPPHASVADGRRVVARRARPAVRATQRSVTKVRMDGRGQRLIAPRVIPVSDSVRTDGMPSASTVERAFDSVAEPAVLAAPTEGGVEETQTPALRRRLEERGLERSEQAPIAPTQVVANPPAAPLELGAEPTVAQRRRVTDASNGSTWRALERTVAPVGVLPAVQRVTADEASMDNGRAAPVAAYRADRAPNGPSAVLPMSAVEARADSQLTPTTARGTSAPRASTGAAPSERSRAARRAVTTSPTQSPAPSRRASEAPTPSMIQSGSDDADAAAFEEAWDEGFETPVALAEARLERRRARRRLRSQSGNLLTALARAGRPEDVIEAILARSGEASTLGGLLPSSATRLVERIANVGEREEQRMENQAAQEARRAAEQVPTRGASRRRAVGRNQQVLRPTRVYRGAMSTPNTTSAGHQGVGSSQVMKLAGKLMNLIHLAENQRKLSEAQGHVRMAEDTASAIAEGSGSADGGGAKAVDMGALQEAVLSSVMREIELIQARRDDPDGRNPWW